MVTKQNHHRKVKLIVNCSPEERDCLQMLASNKQMTISEYFLSLVNDELRGKPKTLNKRTLKAHQEALEGGGTSYESMNNFWSDMEINRSAKA